MADRSRRPSPQTLAAAADMYLTACGVPRRPAAGDFVELPLVMPLYVELAAGALPAQELFVQIHPWAEFWLRAVELVSVTGLPSSLTYGRYGQWFSNKRMPAETTFAVSSNRKHVCPQERFAPGSRLVCSAFNSSEIESVSFYVCFEGVERIFL